MIFKTMPVGTIVIRNTIKRKTGDTIVFKISPNFIHHKLGLTNKDGLKNVIQVRTSEIKRLHSLIELTLRRG